MDKQAIRAYAKINGRPFAYASYKPKLNGNCIQMAEYIYSTNDWQHEVGAIYFWKPYDFDLIGLCEVASSEYISAVSSRMERSTRIVHTTTVDAASDGVTRYLVHRSSSHAPNFFCIFLRVCNNFNFLQFAFLIFIFVDRLKQRQPTTRCALPSFLHLNSVAGVLP